MGRHSPKGSLLCLHPRALFFLRHSSSLSPKNILLGPFLWLLTSPIFHLPSPDCSMQRLLKVQGNISTPSLPELQRTNSNNNLLPQRPKGVYVHSLPLLFRHVHSLPLPFRNLDIPFSSKLKSFIEHPPPPRHFKGDLFQSQVTP